MPGDLNNIKHCVQLLKNADPVVYEELVRLCDQYTYELMEAVTVAPSDQVLLAQGHAQQARKFMQLLTEKPSNTWMPTASIPVRR